MPSNDQGMTPLEAAMDFFRVNGWSPEQAAGIVGNLYHESAGLNPTIKGDGGASFGLAQWNGDRRNRLFEYAQQKGEKVPSFPTQLEFTQWELENSHKPAAEALRSAKTVDDATKAFSNLYEIPGKPMMQSRLNYAKQTLSSLLGPSEAQAATIPNAPAQNKANVYMESPQNGVDAPPSDFRQSLVQSTNNMMDNSAIRPNDTTDQSPQPQPDQIPPTQQPNKQALLAEAYRRGILPDDKKALFEEGARRGLWQLPSVPTASQQTPSPQEPIDYSGMQGAGDVSELDTRQMARDISPYARPVLQMGGAIGGGLLGAGAGPLGSVGGTGIGYSAGTQAANALDEYAGLRQRPSAADTTLGVFQDLATGANMELGGALGAKALEYTMPMLMPFARRLYESALKIPPSVPAAVRDKMVSTGLGDAYFANKNALNAMYDHTADLNNQIAGVIDRATQAGKPQLLEARVEGRSIIQDATGKRNDLVAGVKTADQIAQENVSQIIADARQSGEIYTDRAAVNQRIAEARQQAPQLAQQQKVEAISQGNQLVSDAQDKAQQLLSDAESGANISAEAVARRIEPLKDFYRNAPPHQAEEFLSKLDEIQQKMADVGSLTPQDAQTMKQTIYAIHRKHYGQLEAVSVEADKAIARGLKEELANAYPELSALNEKDSALINLQEALERSVNRIRNYDVIKLGDTVIAAGGYAAGGPSGGFLLGMAKHIIDSPDVKSRLAVAISRASKLNMESAAKAASYEGNRLLSPSSNEVENR